MEERKQAPEEAEVEAPWEDLDIMDGVSEFNEAEGNLIRDSRPVTGASSASRCIFPKAKKAVCKPTLFKEPAP